MNETPIIKSFVYLQEQVWQVKDWMGAGLICLNLNFSLQEKIIKQVFKRDLPLLGCLFY